MPKQIAIGLMRAAALIHERSNRLPVKKVVGEEGVDDIEGVVVSQDGFGKGLAVGREGVKRGGREGVRGREGVKRRI
jgi:hypothetical protein